MTRFQGLLAGLLLAGTAAAARAAADGDGDEVQVIRLKVGTEIVGVVTPDGFDEAHGVRVRRVDDDALLDIGFDQMLPEDARRIRAAHGYMPDDPEPILVDAMKIRFLDGSEMVGVIVEQDVETIKFKHGGGAPQSLKRSGVRSIEPVKVDALEVYDAEELYGREVAARNPTSALDHYNLALYCESLQLWARAKEELGKVTEADASFKADVIAQKQKQYDRRLEAGEDSELIAKSQRLARNDQYDDALKKLDDFLKAKPNSALRADAEKVRARIVKQREHWLGEQTIVQFFTYVDRTIRKIAAEPKATAKECRKRIEAEVTKGTIESTAKFLKVAPAEVQRVWEDAKRQTASPHFGSYGSGTWTIGLEAAMKGLTPEDPNKKADAGAKPTKDESLEDRIKKLIEEKKKAQEEANKKGKKGAGPQTPNKKMASGPQVADVAPTEEDWWAGLTLDEKTGYLTAWWAEHEPNAKVYRFDQTPCATCSGLGSLRYVNPDGQEMAKPCPRCKGLEFDRVVRFH